jgi:hypothetical protein
MARRYARLIFKELKQCPDYYDPAIKMIVKAGDGDVIHTIAFWGFLGAILIFGKGRAGGPWRVPPATHLEFIARREPLAVLTSWRGGHPREDTGGPVTAYETRDYYRKPDGKRMPYDRIE